LRGGNTTCGPFSAASGPSLAGLLFPVLKLVLGVGGDPGIRQQGFQSGSVVRRNRRKLLSARGYDWNGSVETCYLIGAAMGDMATHYYLPLMETTAIASFDSRNVMRFLGHRLCENHEGEIISDYRSRSEGVCVKHRALGNSIKVYDKGGSILRIETTINNPAANRSYRSSEAEPESRGLPEQLAEGRLGLGVV
jgi:hypothetical protein